MRHLYSYSSGYRSARLIAGARFAIVSFSLIEILGDPERFGRHPMLGLAVGAYGVICASQLLAVWTARLPLRSAVLSPPADVIALCVFLTAGLDTRGPLFLLFGLPLVSATVRWRRRGALGTGACLMAVFVAFEAHAIDRPGRSFKLTDVARCAWLGGAAMVLAELSTREAFVNRGLRKLATDPNVRAMDLEDLARDLPRWAAGVLNAPRVLIQWEEADEPWVHVATWENGHWRYAREAPSVDAIAPDLAGADFMCQSRAHRVLRACHGRSSWWHGDPLGAVFRERYAVESVLSARFDGEPAHGRVFILDKPSMVVDDLVLAGLVARQIGNRLNHWYLLQRLTERVAGEERVRLGRDLHDGALHVLAGIALELEGIIRAPNSESNEPDARLRELQASLVAEQRTLRILVERLRASGPLAIPGGRLLSVRLKDLVERLERRWPLRVRCDADCVDELPQALADEVYLIIHEALVNTARHADARTAAASVRLQSPFVRIAVSDDGRGFPFRGTYSGTTLSALGVGPTTLKERTAALGGDLVLESTEHGSRIDICLPARGDV